MRVIIKRAVETLLGKDSRLFLDAYHRVYRRSKFPSIGDLVHQFAQLHLDENVRFLQIGANEGTSEDVLNYYIRRYEWQGVMVEPQAEEFERLVKNFAGVSNLHFENSAVVADPAMAPKLYCVVKEDGLPDWVSKLSSFDRSIPEQVLEHYPHAQIVSKRVPAITLEALIDKYPFENYEVFVTDTEGYDYEILRRIDWDLLSPDLLIFEHHHLSPEDDLSCQNMLKDAGYSLFRSKIDTAAFKDIRLRMRYQHHLLEER